MMKWRSVISLAHWWPRTLHERVVPAHLRAREDNSPHVRLAEGYVGAWRFMLMGRGGG
jgi:hypothetical protein